MRAGRRLLGGEDLVVGVLRGAVPQGLACPLALELGGDTKGVPLLPPPPPPPRVSVGLSRPHPRTGSLGWVGVPQAPGCWGVVAVGRSGPWPMKGLWRQQCGVVAPEKGVLWPRGCLMESGVGWGAWEAHRGSRTSLWFGDIVGSWG